MQSKLLLFFGISMELWAPQSQHTPEKKKKKKSNHYSETIELSVNVVTKNATSYTHFII